MRLNPEREIKMLLKKMRDRLMKKSNVDIARENWGLVENECLILANSYKCFGSEPHLVSIGKDVEITRG